MGICAQPNNWQSYIIEFIRVECRHRRRCRVFSLCTLNEKQHKHTSFYSGHKSSVLKTTTTTIFVSRAHRKTNKSESPCIARYRWCAFFDAVTVVAVVSIVCSLIIICIHERSALMWTSQSVAHALIVTFLLCVNMYCICDQRYQLFGKSENAVDAHLFYTE